MQRKNRLSRSRDFDAVYRQGRSVSTRFLTLYWFARAEEPGEPRLGLAVPKAVGSSVVRNRIKRQLREIWRLATRRRRDPGVERLRAQRAARAARGGGDARPRLARRARRRGARKGRPRDDRRGTARPPTLAPASLGIALVYLYRCTFGLLVPAGTCKYHPSCSQYAIDALRKHGLVKGSVLAGWRLLRCNPWSHGGVDYP